jgi:hypothetical protein
MLFQQFQNATVIRWCIETLAPLHVRMGKGKSTHNCRVENFIYLKENK